MSTLPAQVNFATITADLTSAVVDTTGSGLVPLGAPLAGQVTFTPDRVNGQLMVPTATPPLMVTVKAMPFTLDGTGSLLAKLVVIPGATYTVSFNVGVPIAPFSIGPLVAGTTYDLASLAPTVAMDGVAYVIQATPATDAAIAAYVTTAPAGPTRAALNAAFAGHTNVQVFTTSGTWTKPAGAVSCDVLITAGGGGGGSGMRGAAATLRNGGAGGGGGASSRSHIPASSLTATVAVSVGGGGAGGAAGLVDSTAGAAGAYGGNTFFGGYTQAYCGGGGGGGGTTDAAGGTGAFFGLFQGMDGGGSGAGTAGGHSAGGGAGGGSGGQVTAADVVADGRQGGINRESVWTGVQLGAAGAAGGGAAGSPKASALNSAIGGNGGSGGGGSKTTAGGAGSAGAIYGGGGGGGGGVLNGFASGAGGAGGDGICVVITYF